MPPDRLQVQESDRAVRRILVCGSRIWTNREIIREALEHYIRLIGPRASEPTVIHGDARGADKLAAEEALDLGFWVEAYPADWKAHGKAAGPIRNTQMLDTNPDVVLAFQIADSPGTQHMISEAKRRGIPTKVWQL